jgi:hypothetical protein
VVTGSQNIPVTFDYLAAEVELQEEHPEQRVTHLSASPNIAFLHPRLESDINYGQGDKVGIERKGTDKREPLLAYRDSQ